MMFSNRFGENQPTPQPQKPQEACFACGQPCREHAEIDSGRGGGYRRVPVCDVGCFQELVQSPAAGGQTRGRYPV